MYAHCSVYFCSLAYVYMHGSYSIKQLDIEYLLMQCFSSNFLHQRLV